MNKEAAEEISGLHIQVYTVFYSPMDTESQDSLRIADSLRFVDRHETKKLTVTATVTPRDLRITVNLDRVAGRSHRTRRSCREY